MYHGVFEPRTRITLSPLTSVLSVSLIDHFTRSEHL